MTTFKPKETLSLRVLREQLRYDPKSGIFTWRVAKSRKAKVGSQAGSLTPSGHMRITIASRRFMAHTLAWSYMTGELVVRGIDHRDTIGSNNKWNNLRRATSSQNSMNRGMRSDNITGLKGVCIKKGKKVNPFVAQIGTGGRTRHLGYFATAEQAHAAYAVKAKELFGEYARMA